MTVSQKTGRSVGLSIILVVSLLMFASAAAAEPAAPAWTIATTATPTNFAPNSATNSGGAGPQYYIYATNVGSVDITEPFTVVDQLPTGVVPAPARPPSGEYGKEDAVSSTAMTCQDTTETVTCASTPGVLHPGETVRVRVPIKVPASAAGELVNTATVSGGGAAPATVGTLTTVDDSRPAFSLMSGSSAPHAEASEGDGSPVVQAGSHPYRLTLSLNFPNYQAEAGAVNFYGVEGGVRDASITLPPGVVVNPGVARQCTERELSSNAGCPGVAQVGTVQVLTSLGAPGVFTRPLYNMVAPGGSPGVFAFEVVESVYIHFIGKLNSEGSYELGASANDLLAKIGILGTTVNLWGDPTAASHDSQRGKICVQSGQQCGSVAATNAPFVTMPSACSPSLNLVAEADAWETPGAFDRRTFPLTGLDGTPISLTGCSSLSFDPTIGLKPDEPKADSPSGLSVALHVPQDEEYEDAAGNVNTATSTLRDAKVTLPAGVSVNPAAANGRTACSPAQVGLKTPVGQLETHFTDAAVTCPDASKIGAVEIETPLLKDEPVPGVQVPHVLPGSIYLAQPYENPFGSLLAIYVAVVEPQTGVVIKLAGEVQADATTGQLTATFRKTPRSPSKTSD